MKPFKPKPWNAPRAKQSPAQDAATQRNFAIFKIRGLWTLCSILAEPHRTIARRAIDEDLFARGVEPQGLREARLHLANILDDLADALTPDDMPF